MPTGLRALLALAAMLPLTLVVHSSAPPVSASAEVQLQLADLLFEEGRYNESLAAYHQAAGVEDSAQRQQATMGAVRSALRIAEFETAREGAVALLKAAPRNAEARALFGDSMWAAGLFDESEQAFRDALALQPGLPRGRHGMARSLAARNQLNAALNEAQAALRESPRDAEIHHTVGSIYERMHQYEAAAAAYSNYVNLLPNKDRSDKALWSRAEIRFLRSFGTKAPFEIEGNPEAVHTVPFRLINDKVVVRVRVNDSSEMDFVVDTGSEQTVLSRRTAQRLGINAVTYTLSAGVGEVGLRGLQLARLEALQIGTLKVKTLPCLIKNPPLRDLPTRETESFSPIALGLSVMIDYRRRQLTMGRHLPDEPIDFELPLHVHRLATVRGTVDNDHPVNFVVDTGGEVISISAATASALPRVNGTRHIPLKVYGTSGWDREAFLLPGVDLSFDAIQFRNFPVVVLNLQAPSALLGYQVGGIVGHRFLSKYRVLLDLERSQLRLKQLVF